MKEVRIAGKRGRTKLNDNVTSKCFFVFEGQKTEKIYFTELKLMQDLVGISSLTELINIERLPYEDYSNPQKIIDLLELDLSGVISYGKLITAMIDTLYLSEYLKRHNDYIKEFEELLKSFVNDTLDKDMNDIVDDLESTITIILSNFRNKWPNICKIIMENIEDSIKDQQITYDKEVDTICLVVDRDPESFKDFQFDNVLEICKKNNFKFLISNPCFEFWLLLHFEDVFNYNRESLLQNKKVSNKKRFIDKELEHLLGIYKKNKYDAHLLIQRIHIAIENEKQFCETLPELKYQLGSNIGTFITCLKNREENNSF